MARVRSKNGTQCLRVNTFNVSAVAFGDQTRLSGGVLHVSRRDIETAALSDSRIASATVELVRPDESARVTAAKDVIEPRIKIEGPGQVYSGAAGCTRR